MKPLAKMTFPETRRAYIESTNEQLKERFGFQNDAYDDAQGTFYKLWAASVVKEIQKKIDSHQKAHSGIGLSYEEVASLFREKSLLMRLFTLSEKDVEGAP